MSSVRDFGAVGDGKADDTEALRHAVAESDGTLTLPRGVYRITGTIEVPLDRVGPIAIDGSGGAAELRMAAAGPALRLLGTHAGTGDPGSVRPAVWDRQRAPAVRGLAITGDHPEADGVELVGTMQPILHGLHVRRARHGIRLTGRNRNVLIEGCHVYHNRGAGVFLDAVNLHQTNITGNHISYNRLGGIRIERSEVRNLQITGNDVEYNTDRTHKLGDEPTAEIWIDASAPRASVNEVAITGNTIQARPSPGGCNIRILDDRARHRAPERPPGLFAIAGNVIGNQTVNVHVTGGYGITLTGNTIYSCAERNLRLEDCRHVTVAGCHFRSHDANLHAGVELTGSSHCVLSACTFRDDTAAGQATGASLLELSDCDAVAVSACHFDNGVPYAIDATDCRRLSITGCTAGDDRAPKASAGSIRLGGAGSALLSANILDRETKIEDGVRHL